MLVSLLALGASACWGTADFLAGVRTKTLPLLVVAAGAQLTGLVGLLAVAAVDLAAGGSWPSAVVLWALPGGATGAIGLLGLYRGLAVGAMTVVAPISATSAVVPVAVGLARGERPTTIQAVGIAIALAGVVLAAREPSADGGPRRMAAGVELGLVAAAGIGLALVFLDAAGRDGDAIWAVMALRGAGTAVLVIAIAVVRPARAMRRRDAVSIVGVGVFDTGGNVAFAVAASRGLLSLVAVLGSLYPIVTAFLARMVLLERVSRLQLLGSAAALAGVVLITAG